MREDKSGNAISYPTLAYVHIIFDTVWGQMKQRGWRVLEGKNGKPFVARPGRTQKLYDDNGRQVKTQRYQDVLIMDRKGDSEFDKAVKDKIMKSYNS